MVKMNSIHGFYQAIAPRYSDFLAVIKGDFRGFRDLERSLLGGISCSKVYYVGVGESSNIAVLASRNNNVLGIDFSGNMLAESRRNLQQHGISHAQAQSISANPLTKERLDKLFEETAVLLFHGDAKDISLPEKYFDASVIYCTLPNMSEETQAKVLETMQRASQRVLISVYRPESLEQVLAAYQEIGEDGQVEVNALRLENGLVYRVVPSARLKKIFEGWELRMHEHPFGLVYYFTP